MPHDESWAPAISLLCLLLVSIGCSDSNDPRKFGTVSGKVTSGGAPLPSGTVTIGFSPTNGQKGVGHAVGADGTYSGDVVIGPNKVVVTAGGDARAAINKKYTKEETTPLTIDVKEGENPFDVDLSK